MDLATADGDIRSLNICGALRSISGILDAGHWLSESHTANPKSHASLSERT
jgi:hypothetical protein